MAIKETVFILCLILLPLMIDAEDKTVSSAIQNDEGLVQSLKDDIDEIKQLVKKKKKFHTRREKTLALLDQLSENVEQCSGVSSAIQNDEELVQSLKDDIDEIKQLVKNSKKRKFHTRRKKTLALLDQLSENVEQCSGGCCPLGWDSGEGSCYYIDSTSAQRMSDARKKCQDMGGELAIIESEKENKFIFDLVKKTDGLSRRGVWIGLQRQDNGRFQWVDGTPVVYTGWAPGEPNDGGGREDCAHMYLDVGGPLGGKWNDSPCDRGETLGFACEKQKSC